MSQYQIDLIQSYLKPTDTMLEYGSGGSTLYFSQYVQKYISIEHDINWFDKMRGYKIPDTVQLYYCAPNNQIELPCWNGNSSDFHDYINFVDTLPYQYYDKVLIDGRARRQCGIKILDYIDSESIVFVHDFFERQRYHELKEYYEIVDQDKNNKPSLVVFKKL